MEGRQPGASGDAGDNAWNAGNIHHIVNPSEEFSVYDGFMDKDFSGLDLFARMHHCETRAGAGSARRAIEASR